MGLGWFCRFVCMIIAVARCPTLAKKSVLFITSNTTAMTKGERARCAKSVIPDDTLIGGRLHSEDKTCETLAFSWYDEKSFEIGYEYLLKKESEEVFEVPFFSASSFVYRLPGQFAVGSSIIAGLVLPEGYTRLRVNLLDTTDKLSEDFYTFDTEKILIHIKIEKEKIIINQSDGGWKGSETFYLRIKEDTLFTIEIKSYPDSIQASIDGTVITSRKHVAPPETARVLELVQGPVKVHSIAFKGNI